MADRDVACAVGPHLKPGYLIRQVAQYMTTDRVRLVKGGDEFDGSWGTGSMRQARLGQIHALVNQSG
jgi:hypothetical protein